MKKILVILVLILFLFLILKQKPVNNKIIDEMYPWQIEQLDGGRSRVFGIVLSETTLKEVDNKLKVSAELAIYESKEKLTLEAYYNNVLLGGLIGSFIFTLDIPTDKLMQIKQATVKKERLQTSEIKYKLDKFAAEKVKKYQVKNLIYIPRVQLDEEMIIKRFGKPEYKIKLKTKEQGWHYLYPKKGLDLIYKEKYREVLQFVSPKDFKELLLPLQAH